VSALLLSACAMDTSALGRSGSGGAGQNRADLEKFYNQDFEWESCDDTSLDCATIEVPLDYDNPDGETIEIAMTRRAADRDNPVGNLFVNPGGPGGSGFSVAEDAEYYFDARITGAFNIIGFDPRGVQRSTPVDCLDDDTLGELLDESFDLSTDEGLEEADEQVKMVGQACEENAGDLLPYVGTEYAAQDMDVMRAVVGDEKLNYVGFSYGTSLGGQYADLFPHNVGRMILDGAVDTTVGSAQMSHDQSLGFETALRNYVEDCRGGNACPFKGSTDDALAQIKELFDKSLEEPFPTSDADRPLTQSQFFSGLITPLYNKQNWPILTEAFSQLINDNDGSLFQYLGDLMNDRETDGSFSSNSTEANWAINCADYPLSSDDEIEELAADLRENGTVFGDYMLSGPDVCTYWPYKPTQAPGPYVGEGADPIVVVGTRYDPATPYQWSESLAQSLDSAVLVTWEGDGHTAYGSADACINDPLDDYLIDGTVPEDGLTCSP